MRVRGGSPAIVSRAVPISRSVVSSASFSAVWVMNMAHVARGVVEDALLFGRNPPRRISPLRDVRRIDERAFT